ncbi:beta 1-4 rhamnosyltransferase Cps2T [Weissella confusa]|uniref:beta 1-4 rhamnosyltransferase Cps2T n=1 Tax=Weissella confusa TaxID=1583 RepID=UPI0018F11F80|nr:DUF1972 domain-containing protein [Weissella confusa]MBJ7671171.1 glycosyltransferase family 1 protein [Weissella confusa]
MSKDVYIIGSKGIPARYGGFETFVEKLTGQKVSSNINYHVASMRNNSELSKNNDRFQYNGADVFTIDVPNVGAAKAIIYDLKALNFAILDAEKNSVKEPIFYILASRIGPFIKGFKKRITAIGGTLLLNPDGNEWKRAKWSAPVRKYWKMSESGMVAASDLIIADNIKIEEYIHNEYPKKNLETKFIAYGTDVTPTNLVPADVEVKSWYSEHGVKEHEYYLVVGRFVPENNYETMIREFISSKTTKQLVIVTNVEKNKFYKNLNKKTSFELDSRINFVGTVYNQELLKYIRENAFAYFHGHEVGGTNPSLLEAMATTKLNMLVDVNFNRSVAENSAVYWTKDKGELASLIDRVEQMDEIEYSNFEHTAKKRISGYYTWEHIVSLYEEVFLND